LSPGEDRLFHLFEGSVRRAVRKAEQAGVKVTITDSEAGMEIFHQLYCITRQRHGLPPQPRKFFRHIHQQIIARGQGFIVQATHEDRPVASAIFFTCGNQALYKYGASDHNAQELRANNLVMWIAIKALISRGFESLHFGRTSLANAGLRRFKKSWATAEDQLNYHCYDFRQGQYITQPDHAQGWHTQLFQKVPITLARIIGAILYPHTA
jgi:lipid II:glycine glycyltransferase (peptidoglycan interpeptide bridge formation enzyme)